MVEEDQQCFLWNDNAMFLEDRKLTNEIMRRYHGDSIWDLMEKLFSFCLDVDNVPAKQKKTNENQMRSHVEGVIKKL